MMLRRSSHLTHCAAQRRPKAALLAVEAIPDVSAAVLRCTRGFDRSAGLRLEVEAEELRAFEGAEGDIGAAPVVGGFNPLRPTLTALNRDDLLLFRRAELDLGEGAASPFAQGEYTRWTGLTTLINSRIAGDA